MAKAVAPTPGSKYRIKVGQTISGICWSNAATTIAGFWTIIYDDGDPDYWPVIQAPSGSSRAAVLCPTGQVAKKNGWVVGGLLGGGGTFQRGQLYYQAFVVDTNLSVVSDIIACGYAYAGHVVEFGTFVEPGPAGGPGYIANLNAAQPAAGVNPAVQSVPAGAIQRILSVAGQLVSAVAAANRRADVLMSRGGATVHNYAGGAQPASVTTNYEFAKGAGYSDVSDFALATTPDWTESPLADIFLLAGDTFQLTAINIQGADQWTGVTAISSEEWVMPN